MEDMLHATRWGANHLPTNPRNPHPPAPTRPIASARDRFAANNLLNLGNVVPTLLGDNIEALNARLHL